jgi:branched-chain amino acid transport system ATP-binding protein
VIGPNGAGKSTVFKAIFGLLKVREGHIRLEGQDDHQLEPAQAARGRDLLCAAGPQHLPRALGAPQYRARRGRGRQPHHRHAKADRGGARPLPDRCARKADPGLDLSGGQQKQLEIVRGLLLDPKLVLIDEPSIGLSPMLVQETFDILKACAPRASPS